MGYALRSAELSANGNRPLRLLIVDDQEDLLDSLIDLIELETDRFEILRANNIAQARTHITEYGVDLALIDVKLGDENGLKLLPEICAKYSDAHCIMMTAYRDASYVLEALKLGASDFLYKPMEPMPLITSLMKHADQIESHRQQKLAEQRFKAVFDHTFHWLFMVDCFGYVQEVNHAPLQYADVERAEVLGKALWSFSWWHFSDDNQNRLRQLIYQAVHGHMALEQIRLGNYPLSPLIMEFLAKPVQEEGGVRSIIVECRDITEIYLARESLLQTNELLEQKVYERTIELEYARNAALRAVDEKGQLLSRMSHELRTPLNAILGNAQLLQLNSDCPLEQEQLETVQEIVNAGEKLLGLVDKVLDVARIESGEHGFVYEEISLNEEVAGIIAEFSLANNPYRLTICNQLQTATTAWQVVADRKGLQQVLRQLISNAIKFNRPGGEVIISATAVGNDQLRLQVKDTGIGISSEQLSHIFDPFNHLDNHANTGAGMGLALARRLMEVMGGSINVNSVSGQGSEFWLELTLTNE